MVLVCLPSDALLQHLPSYLGFSYLGHGVSLHSCSSKAQPLLLNLDEVYLLTAAPPDLECGVAPLSPPVPMQPPLLGCVYISPNSTWHFSRARTISHSFSFPQCLAQDVAYNRNSKMFTELSCLRTVGTAISKTRTWCWLWHFQAYSSRTKPLAVLPLNWCSQLGNTTIASEIIHNNWGIWNLWCTGIACQTCSQNSYSSGKELIHFILVHCQHAWTIFTTEWQ